MSWDIDWDDDTPFEEEQLPEQLPLIEEESQQQPNDIIIRSVNPTYTSSDEIYNFINENPNGFLIIPCSQRGLLRIHRNVKRGYCVQFVPVLRDQLEKLINKN